MTTIDIDEATRNAILAALDERAARLERAVAHSNRLNRYWPSEDAQRALVWNIAALHETNMARLQVAEAGEPVPTLAEAVPWEPATKAWTEAEELKGYHDLQAR